MAVETHHHLLRAGGPQKLPGSHAGWDGGGGALCCDAPGSTAAAPGGLRRASCYYAAAGRPLPVQQGYQNHLATAPGMLTTTTTTGQVCAADVASESGVTFGGGGGQHHQDAATPRKRKRPAEQQVLGLGGAGAAGVAAAHLQQQLVDVDRLVLQHTAKMWAELTEQRRRHARQVVAAVEAAAAKRLRAKDEEVERLGRLNWALEDRVRTLFVEAQAWRELAQSNEAAVTALRGELQKALDAQQQQARRRGGAAAAAPEAISGGAAEDAASCCCGENDLASGSGEGEEEEEVATTSATATCRRCTACGVGAAEVLLLPCRHLCACAPCAAVARACPACGCANNGSVRVNFP